MQDSSHALTIGNCSTTEEEEEESDCVAGHHCLLAALAEVCCSFLYTILATLSGWRGSKVTSVTTEYRDAITSTIIIMFRSLLVGPGMVTYATVSCPSTAIPKLVNVESVRALYRTLDIPG